MDDAREDEFERVLEGIFEDRAQEFGPDLREMLRALFREGVRHGRSLERSLCAELERRLDQMAWRATQERQETTRAIESKLVEHHDHVSPGALTLDDVRRAIRELDQERGLMPSAELPGLVLPSPLRAREGEVAGNVNPWSSQTPSSSSFRSFSTSERSYRSSFVRELEGEFVGSSDDTPDGSGSSPSGPGRPKDTP